MTEEPKKIIIDVAGAMNKITPNAPEAEAAESAEATEDYPKKPP